MLKDSIGGEILGYKIVNVSHKRQLTIPQAYYDALGFNGEAEVVLYEEGLVVKPISDPDTGYFAEQILEDLMSQGYSGAELLEKFKKYNRAIRPAVEKLIEEADAFAKSGEGEIPFDELFGVEVE